MTIVLQNENIFTPSGTCGGACAGTLLACLLTAPHVGTVLA